ncbi:MAG: hypothetical protein QNK37_32925 [Acidobacteriota bacterium]|nr:hypothetical protein [Acidobacteriota bacterium]
MSDIKNMVDRIVADGKLTDTEHKMFLSRVNADGKIDASEREQIDRLFSMVQAGDIQVV